MSNILPLEQQLALNVVLCGKRWVDSGCANGGFLSQAESFLQQLVSLVGLGRSQELRYWAFHQVYG